MDHLKRFLAILSRNRVTAFFIILLAVGILFFTHPHKDIPAPSPLPKVRIIESQAQLVRQDLRINGQTQAARKVTLRAETSGRIEKILVKKGQHVDPHQELVILNEEDRAVRLQEAKAFVKQRQKEFAASSHLKAKAFKAENALVAQEVLLASAQTLLTKIENEIQNTHVKAPFRGIFEEQFVEVGDFVTIGDSIATVVELDPLLVKCHVAEKDIAQLHEDDFIKIYLPTFKRTVQGKTHYISHTADPKTRTFLVEIIIDNGDGTIPGGMTAEVILSKGEALGHKISPSYILLNDEGIMGVKIVEEGTVKFVPVTPLNATQDSIWVAGLPEKTQIIVVGADFVSTGQEVAIQQATPES